VIPHLKIRGFLLLALLFVVCVVACHKEEQAVVGVEQTAVNAEHKAQATATVLDQQRAALGNIPLPTKSLYIDVHEPGAWANPFLSVDANTLNLRINLADANTSTMGQGTMLRPAGARRQELVLRPADLAQALIALPPGAWRYGRVVAVAESPTASAKDRPKVRRNLEAVIQQLNDLGIVVEDWPSR
jgi:hypothetical protein